MEFNFDRIEGFEWNSGNLTKSAQHHGITPAEAEEIFYRDPWIIDDTRPGDQEPRFAAIGRSERNRILRVVFTVRHKNIRPISNRPASRKERLAYENALRQRG